MRWSAWLLMVRMIWPGPHALLVHSSLYILYIGVIVVLDHEDHEDQGHRIRRKENEMRVGVRAVRTIMLDHVDQ
jgi:hypothetical protein